MNLSLRRISMGIKKIIFSLFAIAQIVNSAEALKSTYNFDTTYKNIKNTIMQKNIPIFAEFDHSKNAKEAGLELNPTKVIVFGNPKVGTLLMQENQQIATHLPLKISVWQDSKNNVYITYTDIKELAKRYKIKNKQVVTNIDNLLKDIVKINSLYGGKIAVPKTNKL